MVARWLKILMVATVAVFFTLVAAGNLTDYGSNYQFVKHVLSMDTIFPNSALKGRAITAGWAHHLAYGIIIGWEALTALLCWLGAWRLFRRRRAMAIRFNKAKSLAAAGIGAGFLLFTLGFITVGGEWLLPYLPHLHRPNPDLSVDEG
jgi:predicted small integral membrane protein